MNYENLPPYTITEFEGVTEIIADLEDNNPTVGQII